MFFLTKLEYLLKIFLTPIFTCRSLDKYAVIINPRFVCFDWESQCLFFQIHRCYVWRTRWGYSWKCFSCRSQKTIPSFIQIWKCFFKPFSMFFHQIRCVKRNINSGYPWYFEWRKTMHTLCLWFYLSLGMVRETSGSYFVIVWCS